MRVFGGGLILAASLGVLGPSSASAAPIGIGDGGCGLDASPECRLLAIDPFTVGGLEGAFQSFSDVALFSFEFLEETHLTVTTTSYNGGTGFDPTLGLFRDGSIYQYEGPDGPTSARFFDIDFENGNYDDQLDLILAAGSYVMALLAFPNDFSLSPETLQAGFACDDAALCVGVPGQFAFSVTAAINEQPAPIPEPGTLALLGSGAVAAFVRRRAKKRA